MENTINKYKTVLKRGIKAHSKRRTKQAPNNCSTKSLRMWLIVCNSCCKCHPYIFFSCLQTSSVQLSFTPTTWNVWLCGLSELPAETLGCSRTSQPHCLQQTAANKAPTPGFKDLRLRIFSRRLFCADSYESSRLCRHFYQSWPSLKYLQTMTKRSPHVALIKHTRVLTIPRKLPGWPCPTVFGHGDGCLMVKRWFVPKGGMYMLAFSL